LLFSARCALRVEPWIPKGSEKLWEDNLAFVVQAAWDDVAGAQDVLTRSRAVMNHGATACNRLADSDEPLGRCLSYTTCTLAAAIEAAGAPDRPTVVKRAIDAAKLSASITAVWAHAGRIEAGEGRDVVDFACTTTWAAIRHDIAPLAASLGALEQSKDRVAALRNVAPFWEGRPPTWATPPRAGH
jgi:hypothetical protein